MNTTHRLVGDRMVALCVVRRVPGEERHKLFCDYGISFCHTCHSLHGRIVRSLFYSQVFDQHVSCPDSSLEQGHCWRRTRFTIHVIPRPPTRIPPPASATPRRRMERLRFLPCFLCTDILICFHDQPRRQLACGRSFIHVAPLFSVLFPAPEFLVLCLLVALELLRHFFFFSCTPCHDMLFKCVRAAVVLVGARRTPRPCGSSHMSSTLGRDLSDTCGRSHVAFKNIHTRCFDVVPNNKQDRRCFTTTEYKNEHKQVTLLFEKPTVCNAVHSLFSRDCACVGNV